MSDRTKKLRAAAWILTLLSAVLSSGPLILYSAKALVKSNATTTEKCLLLSFISFGVILSLVCVINKYTPRCRIWLILLGFYICLDNILGCILVLGITQILDELLVHPLAKAARQKYSINKELDKRGST